MNYLIRERKHDLELIFFKDNISISGNVGDYPGLDIILRKLSAVNPTYNHYYGYYYDETMDYNKILKDIAILESVDIQDYRRER